jgi:monoamine oxidase
MTAEPCILDAVVIGGGVSGLSAAYQLHRLQFTKFVVLEARDRVGGRTYTVRNPNVTYVDLGGSYVGVTQTHLHRMLRDLNLKTYKVDDTRQTLYYDFDSKYKRPFSSNDSFKIGGWIENLDLNHFLRRLDEIGEQINVEEPWNSPNAKQLDQTSYGEFVDRTCWTAKARRFAKFFININVTCEPYEASLLWFAWYVRQCGGVRRIIATEGGGQDSKVEGGTMQISERIAQRIGEQRVILSDPVHQVLYDQSARAILTSLNESNRSALSSQLTSATGTFCLVQTLSGKQFVTRKVIMAMPPTMQSKIHFEPALPAMRNQLMQRQPMGSVNKFIIYYEKRFWTEQSKIKLFQKSIYLV